MGSFLYRHVRILVLVVLIIIGFVSAYVNFGHSLESEVEIDLFTQKESNNGLGLNMSSEAFSPDEEVKVFALITYSSWPEEGVLVAFQIFGPKNSIENITFSRAAITNETGIAFIVFRLPHSNETTFGEWVIIGNVRVAEYTAQDTLYFKVGWIVDILSIRTINTEYEYQVSFSHNIIVGVELTLRNIAQSSINTTLNMNLVDSANIVVSSSEVIDFTIPANSTIVFQHFSIRVPEDAHFGEANIYANAYNAPVSFGGVPFCPEAKTSIIIEDIIHDIAIVDVQPNRTWAYAGEHLRVAVVVKNFGHLTESFNVTLYYNVQSTLQTIGMADENLKPGENRTLLFLWDTTNLSKGNYAISAYAHEVMGEKDTENNLFVDGAVEIRDKIHDVAVLNVEPHSTSVYIGEKVDVNVVVKNLGDYEEHCRVTLFYESNIIANLSITLIAGAEEVLVFQWETEGVSEGSYMLKAYIDEVVGEENLENNLFVDGSINLAEREQLLLTWVLWLLPFIILMIVLLIIWLYYRRKRREVKREL